MEDGSLRDRLARVAEQARMRYDWPDRILFSTRLAFSINAISGPLLRIQSSRPFTT